MKEYFDTVDGNDKTIGKALRSECHSNPRLIHRGVFVIVANKNGEILLARRSMKKDTNPGKWEIVGEHNKLQESYESAARRGLKEELGINGKVRKLFKRKFSSRRETEFDVIFLCKISNRQKIYFDKGEISEVLFFAPKDIESLIRNKPRSVSSWTIKVFDEYEKYLKAGKVI